MPKAIHDRAKLLMRKNPNMPEGEAWGIATNQMKGKTASFENSFLLELGEIKQAFSTNEYSGPMGSGPFNQTSSLPPFHAPSLGSVLSKKHNDQEKADKRILHNQQKLGMMSPKGQLASDQRTGTGKSGVAPGPSIAEISKPVGIGTPLPGALKNTI